MRPLAWLDEARRLFPRLRTWRRQIHQYPELAFQETRTAGLVAQVLRQAGYRVTSKVAKTGVVGLLDSGRPGPVMAIRADMDGLPIHEQSRAAYRSRRPGCMHACGHDGNTAMALGAAVLLARHRQQWAGQVKMIFQPSEEVPPGGAKAMVEAGVLGDPEVQAIIAGHVDASLPMGRIALKSGPIMAAADAFNLILTGRGGHGAMPHRSVDAMVAAGQVIVGLQTLVSREMDPAEPVVVTVGQIEGGQAFNVIAETVRLRGTFRTLTPALRRDVPRRIQRLASGISRAMRVRCQLDVEWGHPALANHPGVTRRVGQAAAALLGRRGVVLMDKPLMTGEDFTYFAAKVPACFFRVGVHGTQPDQGHPWHHPRFDLDERGLITGCAVLAKTAADFGQEKVG